MVLEPIVCSLLDTDLYKFNMDQVLFHNHKDVESEYRFKLRNKNIRFTKDMIEEIDCQIDHLCSLRFSADELDYLRSLSFIKDDYVDFLSTYQPDRSAVKVALSEDFVPEISIKGKMCQVMQFEIYLLEIVNEVYFRMNYDYDELLKSARRRLDEKLKSFSDGTYTFSFAEFGCRRRLSRSWEDELTYKLKDVNNMIGTSNVYFAKKYGLKPIGTYAHEFVQMFQQLDGIDPAFSNYYAMKEWFEEYRGENATALTDTITTDIFLLDFDRKMMDLYTGVRHDSSDPYLWGEKMIRHFEVNDIDPKTKMLLFSDGLDFDRAQKLYDYFKDKTKVSFGIGTFVTNDTDVDPLNIVIKLQYVNSKPVAKLSDSDDKTMCQDDEYLKALYASIEKRMK